MATAAFGVPLRSSGRRTWPWGDFHVALTAGALAAPGTELRLGFLWVL